jgi:chromosome segregation ATPase
MRRFPLMLTLSFVLLLAACQTDGQRDTTAADAQPVPEEEVQTFRAEMQQELTRIDQQITAVEQEAQATPEDQRDQHTNRVQDLRQQRQQLEQDLQQMQAEDRNRWRDQRHDYDRRVRELTVEVNRTRMEMAENRERFERAAEDALQNVERHINRIQQSAQAAPADQRQDFDQQMADLNMQHAQFRGVVDQIGEVPQAQFEEMRSDVISNFNDLGSRLTDVRIPHGTTDGDGHQDGQRRNGQASATSY